MTAATATRQPTGTARSWLVLVAIGCIALAARVETNVPRLGEAQEVNRVQVEDFTVTLSDRTAVLDGVRVETGFHAEARHGLAEAEAVRQACIIRARENPAWWNRPPCKDGRWRYVIAMADGSWGIWVHEPSGVPMVRKEVTAFKVWGERGKNYVKAVRDQCGGDDGHSYAEGQRDQEGVRTETTAVRAG